MKRGILGLAAALCLLLVSMPMAPAAGILAYCVAVDEWIPDPLTADTRPINISGQIYIPEGLFTHSRSNMGISVARGDNNSVRLYKRTQILSFDISAATATDQEGSSYAFAAVVRDGRVYFPARNVCNFFNLQYKYEYTQYTDFPLVYIRTEDALLSREEFLNAAISSIADRREKIVSDSQAPSLTPDPTPTSGGEPGSGQLRRVYLSFHGAGDETGRILDALEQYQVKALFLLTPEELSQHDDLVRRMVGQGHSIGLRLPADGSESVEAAYLEGNRLLEHIARVRTAIIALDGGASLAPAGTVLWTSNVIPNITGQTNAARASQIKTAIDYRERAYVALSEDNINGDTISRLLRQLSREEYRILTPIITNLS